MLKKEKVTLEYLYDKMLSLDIPEVAYIRNSLRRRYGTEKIFRYCESRGMTDEQFMTIMGLATAYNLNKKEYSK